VTVTAGQIIDKRRQILIPIHQKVKEFVESGDDWRNRKTKAQDLIRLITRFTCCYTETIEVGVLL
jgi:hypothetical protein